MIDLMFKADSREAFEQFAVAKGWLLVIPEAKVAFEASGVAIDHIGSIQTAAATYNEKTGEELTPAEFDTAHHVNVRLAGPAEAAEIEGRAQVDRDGNALKTMDRTATGAAFKRDGVTRREKAIGRAVGAVTMIDETSVSSPARVWQ